MIKTGRTTNKGYSGFGKKVKRKLIDKEMTATQLAKSLGISPQYLNAILHGHRSGKKYVAEIGRILGIEIAA